MPHCWKSPVTAHHFVVLMMCCFFCVSFLFVMIHVYLCYAVLSVPCSLIITCLEIADLLAFFALLYVVLSFAILLLSHKVFQVVCGTWSHWFLIFALLNTIYIIKVTLYGPFPHNEIHIPKHWNLPYFLNITFLNWHLYCFKINLWN